MFHRDFFQEVEAGNKSAIIIYIPVPQLRQFHKIQVRLVRELEKKFGGKHVLFLCRVSSVFDDYLRRIGTIIDRYQSWADKPPKVYVKIMVVCGDCSSCALPIFPTLMFIKFFI